MPATARRAGSTALRRVISKNLILKSCSGKISASDNELHPHRVESSHIGDDAIYPVRVHALTAGHGREGSRDGGKNWETSWVMDFTRVE